jgi:hypothetical protein
MAARQLYGGRLQPFACHATLKVDGEESVVTSADHVDGDLGPGVESARLAEDNIRLVTLAGLALLDDLGRDVVQEVGGEVEGWAVATATCSGLSAPRSPRCCPTTLQPSPREPESSR